MRILATGTYAGKRREVSWTAPGTLSGDQALRDLFHFRIVSLEGEYVGPPEGGGRSNDQMGWPGAFVWVARELLTGCEFSGELDGLNESYGGELIGWK